MLLYEISNAHYSSGIMLTVSIVTHLQCKGCLQPPTCLQLLLTITGPFNEGLLTVPNFITVCNLLTVPINYYTPLMQGCSASGRYWEALRAAGDVS